MSKIWGALLLIVGTTIGGGMLALPIANAAGGFLASSFMMIACWSLMTFCATLILEVNLWHPNQSNMISMARATLPKIGVMLTWVSYLLLLYCLLSAYISGGADLLQSLLLPYFPTISIHTAAILFTFLMGSIVVFGIRSVDWANRGLMTLKLSLYLLIICIITPKVHVDQLYENHPHLLLPAVLLNVTSFSYAIIVPSLRAYFGEAAPKLLRLIVLSSFIPLLCYLLWDFVVMGTLPRLSLMTMMKSGHEVSALTEGLAHSLTSPIISMFVHIFTEICVLTAFLAVSLALSDFLSDGLSLSKTALNGKVFVYALTFLPPLCINLFYPEAFVFGLHFAGIFCVLLLALLPAWMSWRGRYVLKLPSSPIRIPGGKPSLIFVFISCCFLLCLSISQLR